MIPTAPSRSAPIIIKIFRVFIIFTDGSFKRRELVMINGLIAAFIRQIPAMAGMSRNGRAIDLGSEVDDAHEMAEQTEA